MRRFKFSFPFVILFALTSTVPVAALVNDGTFDPSTTVVQPKLALLATCADSRPETPREPTAHIFGTETVRGGGSGMVAEVNGCPLWVYGYALGQIQQALDEECGVGNSYVSHIYCITLQEGGYHVMAEADCLS